MNNTQFGELLRVYRTKNGFAQVQLANELGFTRRTVSNWEISKALPSNRDTVLQIGKILSLPLEDLNSLLLASSFPQEPIATEDIDEYSESLSNNDSFQELNIQLQDIQNTINFLSQEFRMVAGNDPSEASENLLNEIQNLQQTVVQLRATSTDLTAPVRIPTPDELEVRLIATTSFSRLEEYRSDENFWFSFFGISLGAIFAILINLVTGGESDINTWIFLGMIVFFSLVTGGAALSVRLRGNRLKMEILKQRGRLLSSIGLDINS